MSAKIRRREDTESIEGRESRVSPGASLIALLCFVAANGISYMAMQARLRQVFDGYAECGFPFSFYGYGGFTRVSRVMWGGLVADYLVATLVSMAVGTIWRRVKMSAAKADVWRRCVLALADEV